MEEDEAMEEGSATPAAEGNINISGSSTVEPISTKVAELYEVGLPRHPGDRRRSRHR